MSKQISTRNLRADLRRGSRLDKRYDIEQLIRMVCARDCKFDRNGAACFMKKNPDGSKVFAHRYCNMLNCRTCFRRLYWTKRENILCAATELDLNQFWTLTVPKEPSDTQEARIKKGFSRLKRKLKDHLEKSLSYVWVIGTSNDRMVHLHVLTNAKLSRNRLRKLWHAATGGQQAKVKTVPQADLTSVVHYLLCNEIHSYGYGAVSNRRISSSRDIHLGIRRVQSTDGTNVWSCLQASTSYIAEREGVLHNWPVNVDRVQTQPDSTFVSQTIETAYPTPAPLWHDARQGGEAPAGAGRNVGLPVIGEDST